MIAHVRSWRASCAAYRGADVLGRVDVADLRHEFLGQQDVLRLYIPVHVAFAVHEGKACVWRGRVRVVLRHRPQKKKRPPGTRHR